MRCDAMRADAVSGRELAPAVSHAVEYSCQTLSGQGPRADASFGFLMTVRIFETNLQGEGNCNESYPTNEDA